MNPYRPEPVVHEKCPQCGEAWDKHHVEAKRPARAVGDPDGPPKLLIGHLIECPRGFGGELLDGRVPVRPPTGVILDALRRGPR